jgi:hypothetical protein
MGIPLKDPCHSATQRASRKFTENPKIFHIVRGKALERTEVPLGAACFLALSNYHSVGSHIASMDNILVDLANLLLLVFIFV